MRQLLPISRWEIMGDWSGEADGGAEWTERKALKVRFVGKRGEGGEQRGGDGGWWARL